MEFRRIVRLLAIAVVMVAACGDCADEGTGSGQDLGGGDADSLDQGNGDANVTDGMNGVTDMNGVSDVGDVAMTDGAMNDTGVSCDIYSTLCNGSCIPTQADPDNCGGCGVTCSSNQVCSGGRCVDGCFGNLEVCDRRCVDTTNDSEHCGMCGNDCGDGQGCVDETCVDGIDVDFDAAQCSGGGPVIDLGDVVVDEQQCSADLAELTFRFGVCSCSDFDINNQLTVDAYDSSVGPYTAGGLGGGVGVNGGFTSNDGADISGTLWVAGTSGVVFDGPSSVGLRLFSGGDVTTNDDVTIGRDAAVDGALNLSGSFDVARDLTLPVGATAPSQASYQDFFNADIDVPLPCTECPPDDHIDVAGIVAAFTDPADNDNSVIGLDADVFNPASDAPLRLDLPCGRYVLNGINSDNPLTIVAHGNTALFVDGDITANNPLTITLTPDAQLDVFVSGDVETNNAFKIGSPEYPALMRMYVGGTTGFTANNPVTLGGYLYAVPGSININNEVEVFGGLYSGDVTANNPWNIHYDRRVTTVGDSCPDPDPDPDPDADMGTDAGGPDSGMGNGTGTTCTTQGDACSDSSECCSPLTCENGTCQLLDCVPTLGSCSDNSQCCSGICSSSTDGICVVN